MSLELILILGLSAVFIAIILLVERFGSKNVKAKKSGDGGSVGITGDTTASDSGGGGGAGGDGGGGAGA